MVIRTDIEFNVGTKTFASGLLVELIAALRRMGPGDLLAVVGSDPTVGIELETWCRFTRNSLVDVTVDEGRHRWVIRCGEAPENADAVRPVGSRLWLYTNFDCNLRCEIGRLGYRPAARRNDYGRPAEIGIAHRDRPAAVVAPGIGLQIGEIGIPRFRLAAETAAMPQFYRFIFWNAKARYVDARRRVRGRRQQRSNLQLVALEQHDLDRKMGFLMEVMPHALPDRYPPSDRTRRLLPRLSGSWLPSWLIREYSTPRTTASPTPPCR